MSSDAAEPASFAVPEKTANVDLAGYTTSGGCSAANGRSSRLSCLLAAAIAAALGRRRR